jgi:serine/threonine protein kinase
MHTRTPCPDGLELQRLLLGHSSDDRAAVLEEHVSDCPTCGERLSELSTTDGLVEVLRGLPAVTARLPRGPVVEDLRRRGRQIGVLPVSTGSAATVATGDAAASRRCGIDVAGFLDPPQQPDELGRLGTWRVLRLIGRGGMGVVFLAEDSRLKRLAALKLMIDARFADPRYLTRFDREGQSLARLRHPNIVQIYEVGEHRGRPYLALEYVAGRTLAQHLAGMPPPVRFSAELVRKLAEAVHDAHQQGVLHRDLKPTNVLLAGVEVQGSRNEGRGNAGTTGDPWSSSGSGASTLDSRPVITDFGLSKPLDEAGLTHTGELVGTPGYMAPELMRGETASAEGGRLVDVYSLGCILYEMLTGHPPFRGATVLETLDQARTLEPVPPRRLQPKLPREIETICLKCLEQVPHRRYPSAQELADDLRRFVHGEPIRARPVSNFERLRKWAGRKPALAASLALSALSVLGLVAGLWLYSTRLRVQVLRAEAKELEAREQRERADANYQQARKAINQMLGRLNDQQFTDAPRAAELRHNLQEDALTFFQSIPKEQENPDPAVRLDVALAYKQISNIQLVEGRYAEAEQNLEHARALSQSLADAFPENLEYRVQLADVYFQSGLGLARCARHDDAIASLQKALDLRQELTRAEPENADWLADLARTYSSMGVAHVGKSIWSIAEANWLCELPIWEELVHDHPEIAAYQYGLGKAYSNLGQLRVTEDPTKAEDYLRKAESTLTTLVRDHPEDIHYLYLLGNVEDNWGRLLNRIGATEAAVDRYSQAIRTLDTVLEQEPRFERARNILACALGGRALAYIHRKQEAEAANDWARALQLAALVGETSSFNYDDFCMWCGWLVRAQAHALAAAGAETVAQTAGNRPDGLYHVAVLWTRCMPVLRQYKWLTQTDQELLADYYASQAVALLRKLQEQGDLNAERTKNDPDLEPLRNRDDFHELVSAAEGKAR